MMHPTAKQCQTPRMARFFVKHWWSNEDHYKAYNFWHTNLGPVIFRKAKDRYGETIYKIMSPISRKWAVAQTYMEFELIASEMLASGFKNENTNIEVLP